MTIEHNKLLRNGSGYADYTAYKAIKNLEGEETGMECLRSEIYEFETPNSLLVKKALIISADYRKSYNTLSAIVLDAERKGSNPIEIDVAGVTMYANPEMVSFVKWTNLGKFIAKASKEEMKQVDEGICKALGIERTIEAQLPPVIHEMPAPVELNEELASAKAEAKIYKELYEQLLAKVITR